MIANKVSDGDPDNLGFDEPVSPRNWMTNTKWNNPNECPNCSLDGYYNPTRYDQHAINQTTARDMAILAIISVNEFPETQPHQNAKITSRVQIMKKLMKTIIIL